MSRLDEHHHEAAMANELHQRCVKTQYDRSIHPCTFSQGDLVLVYDQYRDKLGAGKFEPLWHDPYVVTHLLKKGPYELPYYDEHSSVEPRNGIYLKKYYSKLCTM